LQEAENQIVTEYEVYADFDTLAEDRRYRVLDRLHPHRAAIEAALV
jgi:hypothetical protein